MAVACANPSNFNNRSLILGEGNVSHFVHLFSSLKSVRMHTSPVFFGSMKVGAAHWVECTFLNVPCFVSQSVSFFVVASWAFGVAKACALQGLAPSFSFKWTGSMFALPTPPLKLHHVVLT